MSAEIIYGAARWAHKIHVGAYRKRPSNWTRSFVFASRYLTMIGVYKDRLQRCPAGCEIAREPGTTTASSGIISGSPSVAAYIFSRTKAYTADEPFNSTP